PRAARWSLDDGDAQSAMARLQELPQGAARRTVALRMKLKAARRAGRTGEAMETARLLAKHRAFSPAAADSIVRGLAVELLNHAHDPSQLQRVWAGLEPTERAMPELATHAAQRLTTLGGEPQLAREWLLPVWDRQEALGPGLKVKLVSALEDG
ncbi:MAG: heme biosynthesis protein HemY, partial [Pseudomonadota bacterium]|nr:heme biosynthesis protein HemY [Pseudomonadota bacterium]